MDHGTLLKDTRLHDNEFNIYKVNNPSPLQVLLEDFKTFASEKFHLYYDMNAVSISGDANLDRPPCSCSCKSNHICSMEFIDLDGYEECIADPSYTCGGQSLLGNLGLSVCLVIIGRMIIA